MNSQKRYLLQIISFVLLTCGASKQIQAASGLGWNAETAYKAVGLAMAQDLYPMGWQKALRAQETRLSQAYNNHPIIKKYNSRSLFSGVMIGICKGLLLPKIWSMLMRNAPPSLYGLLEMIDRILPTYIQMLNLIYVKALLIKSLPYAKFERIEWAIDRFLFYKRIAKILHAAMPDFLSKIRQLARSVYNRSATTLRAPAIVDQLDFGPLAQGSSAAKSPLKCVFEYAAQPVELVLPVPDKEYNANVRTRDPYNIRLIQQAPNGSMRIQVEEYGYDDATALYSKTTHTYIIDKELRVLNFQIDPMRTTSNTLIPGCTHTRSQLLADGTRCTATLRTLPTPTAQGELHVMVYDENTFNIADMYAKKNGLTVDAIVQERATPERTIIDAAALAQQEAEQAAQEA